MPNKKITVVGDGAEEPLTPEEEHRLEVRVDQMMDPNVPDEPGAASTPQPISSPLAVPEPEAVAAETDAATSEPEPTAAPPVEPTEAPEPPAAPEPASEPEPEAKPEGKPEEKKVTKIVTKFADDDEADDAIAAVTEPAQVPDTKVGPVAEAESLPTPAPVEVPKPAKPTAKKITIRHHDDEADEEAKAATPEEPKAKGTKAKPTKAKKAKTAPAKKSKARDDNLETEADAIAAAALAAAEQLQTKQAPASEAEPDSATAAEPAPEAEETAPAAEDPPATEVADLPTAPDTADATAKGAPPLIQKHSAAPIGADAGVEESAETPVVPMVGKKINIVDNSGAEPEVIPASEQATAAETAETTAGHDELAAAEPESESAQAAADEPVEEETEPVTPDVEKTEPGQIDDESSDASETSEVAPETAPAAAAAAATAPTAEEPKKYRPPEGPIQFKRAEVPIEPYKPGTGPRPAEPADDLSEDAAIAQAFETKEASRPKFAVKKVAGKGLKAALLVVVLLIVLAVTAVAAVPAVRNRALAVAGVKGDVHLTVLDAADNSPLSGATVTAGNATATTTADGTATLHQVKLGSQQISIQKYAFAAKSQAVNVAWHAQNSVKTSLTTTGQHYHLTVIDYLSGKPISGAKVSAGQSDGLSNATGTATLVAPSGNPTVTVSAVGYSPGSQAVSAGQTATVTLKPSGLDVYIARGSGKLNVYKNSVDGRNEQPVLSNAAASATDLAIAPNDSGSIAALVSTRDNTRDSNGNLEDSLTLITTADGKTTVADHADSVNLVDWFGSRVVYILSKTTTSTTDDNRYQLVSYDTATSKRTVLDHTAYLNDVLSANGMVYYATAASGSSAGQFIGIKPDGSGKKVILTNEIAAITRTSHAKVALSSVNKWYTYTLGDGQPTVTSTATSTSSRQYMDSPNGQYSAYVDTAASMPRLMLFNKKSGTETPLAQAAGITYPVHWLGNGALVYRGSHGGAVTDDAISPNGGTPKVIASVSDIAGIGLWNH